MYLTPTQQLNEKLRQIESVKTNAEYRKFVMRNSGHLRGYNLSTAALQVSCQHAPNNTVASEDSDLKTAFLQKNF